MEWMFLNLRREIGGLDIGVVIETARGNCFGYLPRSLVDDELGIVVFLSSLIVRVGVIY